MKKLALFLLLSISAFAQNYRVDDVVTGRSGQPVPAATIAVCSQVPITAISEVVGTVTVTTTLNPPQGSTVTIVGVTPTAYNGSYLVLTTSPTSFTYTNPTQGLGAGTIFGSVVTTSTTPCAPLASLCSSYTDTVCASPNPVTGDGLGNYHFYVTPGHYTRQFYGTGLTARIQTDQVFPCDPANCALNKSNGVYIADQQTGINACDKTQTAINKAIADGGGTVDARSLIGTQACGTTVITLGNASLVPVTLLLPPTGSWQWNGNIGATCGISLYPKSSIHGTMSGEGNPFAFRGASGFVGNSVFCTVSVTVNGDYYRANGFSVKLDSGATANTAVTSITGMADDARIDSVHTVVAAGATATKGLLVTKSCCGASLYEVGVDASNNAGTVPCTFGDGASNLVDVGIYGMSCVHQGTGLNALLITGAGFTGTNNFYGTFSEGGTGADTTTAYWRVDTSVIGAQNFFGGRCSFDVALSANYCLDIAAGSRANFIGVRAAGNADVNCVDDHNKGTFTINGDTNGNCFPYSSYMSPMQIALGGGPTSTSFPSAMLTLLPDASHTGLFVSNQADSLLNGVNIDAGLTATASRSLRFLDRNTEEWTLNADGSNIFTVRDIPNSLIRLLFQQNNKTEINSGTGANAVQINNRANTGTGGVLIASGGASPSTVAAISGAGLMTTYNGIATTGNGVSSQLATVDLTNQGAVINTTTLYSVPATGAGQYRLIWNAKVTTAATTGAATSTLGGLTIVYTDPDGVAQTISAPGINASGSLILLSTGNSTTTVMLGSPLLLNCKASTNITYAFNYVSDTAGQMKYNLHIKLEAL